MLLLIGISDLSGDQGQKVEHALVVVSDEGALVLEHSLNLGINNLMKEMDNV